MTSPLATTPPLDTYRGDRAYLGADHERNERRTWLVVAICLVTMAVQVGGGIWVHSMALIANGLHLAAHIVVLGAAAGAYGISRTYARDPRLAFGTGKLGYLVGFANGVILAITGALIGIESLQRLLKPEAVAYSGALELAAFALAVNLVCVWLLRPRAPAGPDADGDLNLSAAHLHLSADAVVSALALLSLLAGKIWHLSWTDPLAAVVGAVLVCHFAWRLLLRTGAALLDAIPSQDLLTAIRHRLEADGTEVIDLHVWRLGPGHLAAIIVLGATTPEAPTAYRKRLEGLGGLSHITIEVRRAGET
ncbi:MAG: cation diffusion facilitator family transporter [Alphaproteobacteria bacterium]